MLTQVTSLEAIYQICAAPAGATDGFIQLIFTYAVVLPKTCKQTVREFPFNLRHPFNLIIYGNHSN